jgi:diguanylate cyclase (GGDEF)-like protein/putative nucleotidyltransferase with HDIG domain
MSIWTNPQSPMRPGGAGEPPRSDPAPSGSLLSRLASWILNDPSAAALDPVLEQRIGQLRGLGIIASAMGIPVLVAERYWLLVYGCLAIDGLFNMIFTRRAVVEQPYWLRVLYACSVFDILVATSIIAVTVGPASPFTLGYFPIIVHTAIRFGARAGTLTSIVAMVCFVIGVILAGHPAPISPLYLLGGSFLVVTGTMSSLLSSRVRRAEQALAHQLEQERALNSASRSLVGDLEWTQVLQRIAEQGRELAGADFAILDLRRLPGGEADLDEGEVVHRATETRPSGAYLAKVVLQSDLLATLPAPTTGLATIHQTAAPEDPIGAITPAMPRAWLLRVPIMIQSQWHGDLLLLRTPRQAPFSETDASIMPAFANQAALMLENARLYRRAVRQAVTDPITNLPNHRALKERLDAEITRASRYGHSLCVLMLDIDHFKAFNDTFGHAAGDQALSEVANILRRALRRSDFAARYGGEEFVLVLPETTTDEGARVAERLRTQVANLAAGSDSRLPASVTVSIGLAVYPDDRLDRDQLLQAADLAMYLAKHEGRNQARRASELGSQRGAQAVLDQLVSQLALPSIHLGPQLVSDLEGRFRRLALLRSDTANSSSAKSAEFIDNYTVEAVTTLATTLEAKDNYTAGHSRQVASLGRLLASALGCDAELIETIRVGGLLHDIGKIGIPESVLNKPGKLDDQEWLLMRSHPDIGARILAPVTALRPIIPIVRHHHERWDGQGYPLRLAGEETPLMARIICLCDAYDTMVSDRPYRRGLGHEEAIRRLIEGAGTQFDPHLVKVFTSLPEAEIAAALSAVKATVEVNRVAMLPSPMPSVA